MTLQQIKYFICVAEFGSISETANRMYVAQSSVSSAIRELESYYNIQAFQRGSKGVVLTEAGKELLMDLRVIQQQMELLDYKYSIKREEKTALSVVVQHHICGLETFLTVAKQLETEEYSIGFFECCTSDIYENIECGHADIGIFFFAERAARQIKKELKNRNLLYHNLGESKLHIYLSKKHPLVKKGEIYMRDLTEYPCITYDRVPGSNSVLAEVLAPYQKKIAINDRAVACTLLRNLNAFVVGSGYCIPDPCYKDILALPIQDGDKIDLGWIVRRDYKPSEIAQQFLKLL